MIFFRLGGGDLDGDGTLIDAVLLISSADFCVFSDYTLIWDQRFVQSLKVYDPMDYEAPDPISVKHVTQKHLNEVRTQRYSNLAEPIVDDLVELRPIYPCTP